MENKKTVVITALVIIVLVVALAFWALLKSKKEVENVTTPPPAANITDQDSLGNVWRSYEASVGKYSIALPPTWFVDQDSVIGGGSTLLVSNTQDMNLTNPNSVVLEFFPNLKRKSGDSLFASIKANGKKDGSFGETEASATDTGYEVFRVDHAYGNPKDGPGYAIARSKTEYAFVVASSNMEKETVEKIIDSLVFLK